MTFSIVAADTDAGDWGVAVASKFLAVGAVVPYARAGVGAVATQAWANTDFGPQGLDLMESGSPAPEVLAQLIHGDEGRADRQLGIVDGQGLPATFTGQDCLEWAGGSTGPGFACQGNILVGANVVAAMGGAFTGTTGDLVDRLLAALQAGDDSGGDRRGRQSAALLVVREGGGYEGRSDRYVDVRVDEHPQAVTELARVFAVYDREVLVRNDPLLPATPELVQEIQRRLTARGIYSDPPTGVLDDPTRIALAAFAGAYNLEGRLRNDEQLSEMLVRELRDITPEVS
ncbi:MAG: DUF1028 domain-containing protein [Actinomycetota bacterium]